jgi:hypothetical protein
LFLSRKDRDGENYRVTSGQAGTTVPLAHLPFEMLIFLDKGGTHHKEGRERAEVIAATYYSSHAGFSGE